jgi:hypothetical protein
LGVSARANVGARRGALFGVYFFGLTLLIEMIRRRNAYVIVAPVTAAIAVIGGFVIGGALLLIGLPYVKTTARAVLLGIVSAYPAMAGLAIASIGLRLAVLIAALGSALIVGGIGGVIMFRRWYRPDKSGH